MACAAGEASFAISITTVGGMSETATHDWVLPSANCVYTYSVSYDVQVEPNGTAHIISWDGTDGSGNFHVANSVGGNFSICQGPYQDITGSGVDIDLSADTTLSLVVGDFSDGSSVCSGLTGTATYTLTNTQDDNPVCWSITGTTRGGRKWQKFNPNRLPSSIRIPRDVDPDSCVVIEDGLFVPRRRYELIVE